MVHKKKTNKTELSSRRLAKPEYKSFKLSKKIAHGKKPLPKARTLFWNCLTHLTSHKRIFIGILAIYALSNLLLVRGLMVSSDLSLLKDDFSAIFSGLSGRFLTGFALYGYLLSSASETSSNEAQLYQAIILILVSLALIWALRQTHAKKLITIRDSFYKGMYPLIPFLAILLVIGIQCIPAAIASWLFNATIVSGLAVTGAEQFLWGSLCFLLVLLTIYMVSSSVFALYVATLPDMTPMRALRSTRDIVRHRRWEIIRKVLFLPTALVIIGVIVMLPILMIVPMVAEFIFFVLSMLAVVISHSYFYSLYRELL